jgi:hypothetical protein
MFCRRFCSTDLALSIGKRHFEKYCIVPELQLKCYGNALIILVTHQGGKAGLLTLEVQKYEEVNPSPE